MILTKVEDKRTLGNIVNVVAVNVMSYHLGNDDCVLRYELRYRDPNRESPAIPDTMVGNGMWTVPTEVLTLWTGTNEFLSEKFCEAFDFTVIEHIPS
jgi:hypothetical protein